VYGTPGGQVPSFRNSYTATGTSVALTATKAAKNGVLTNNQFEFAVLDAAGNTVATGKNTAAGAVTFGQITYNTAGVYEYTMVETSPSGGGWTVDPTIHTATVTVTDSGTGLPPGFDIETTTSLGLQIVRTLVEGELGGRISLRPRAGGGTIAVVDLPVRYEPKS